MASIEKRANGSYRIVVSCGYDTKGKKIREPLTISADELEGLTEKQIDKELNRRAVLFEQKVRNGTFLDGEKITFGEFAEKWITDYAEKQLAPKTLYENKKMLEHRIIPALGHIKLAKLQPTHIINFYNNLAENGMRLDYKYVLRDEYFDLLRLPQVKAQIDSRAIKRLSSSKPTNLVLAERLSTALVMPIAKIFKPVDIEKGLSTKTISNHHGLISSILTAAVQWQVIFSNPCDRVKPPKKIKKEAAHYDDEQTAQLLALLNNEPLQNKTFVYLAIFTGARLGELSALSWDDIDFNKQTLKISKALQYLPGVGAFEKSPKTEKSNRTIYLSDTVLSILEKHRKGQIEERLKCGSLWKDRNKIFTRWDGEYISPTTMTEWFRRLIRNSNLPPLTFHQLRHTNATLMIAEGIDVVTISKRLGHSQPSTTVNIYSHALQKADKEASNKLDMVLNKQS